MIKYYIEQFLTGAVELVTPVVAYGVCGLVALFAGAWVGYSAKTCLPCHPVVQVQYIEVPTEVAAPSLDALLKYQQANDRLKKQISALRRSAATLPEMTDECFSKAALEVLNQ